MIYKKVHNMIAFAFILSLNTDQITSQESSPTPNNRGSSFYSSQINKEITFLHENIRTLAAQYKQKFVDNKLRVSIGIGLHDIFEDTEEYVFRNDAFLYFSKDNTPQSLRIVYEQTNIDTLTTEVRIIDMTDLLSPAPFPIKVQYISWTLNQENGDKEATMKLVQFSDTIIYPPGASVVKYSVEEIKKPKEKYHFLLTYRKIIKKLERTMLLYVKSQGAAMDRVRRRSLELGK